MIPVAADPAEIIGRSDALLRCHAALDRMVEGQGGLLLIAGEPGIGKTTLLQATVAAATTRGCDVRWVACVEDDAVPAFWPFVRLLADSPDENVSSVATELEHGVGDAERHRVVLFDKVATALRQSADATPQVLILDDLQWADPSSLRLLAFLVKQLRTARVLFLGSYRDTDVGPDHPLSQLLAEPGTSGETILLGGLSTDGVAALIERAGATGATAAVEQIHMHTGGNPFFVLHVFRLLEAEGHFAVPAATLPLPVGVRSVLERRLARLSQSCAELLSVAAVIGAGFDVTVLSDVSGRDVALVEDLLAESAAARLTRRLDGRRHEFAHALVRATAASQLSASQTASLHGAIADALAARTGRDNLQAIAHHELNAGPERASSRGVAAAQLAGRAAVAAQAYEQAAEQFARAIAACTDPDRVTALHLELGDARLRAGDWHGATGSYVAAADLARSQQQPALFAAAVLGVGSDAAGFEVRLHDHAQLALLDEAIDMIGSSDLAVRSRLLARRSVASTNVAAAADRVADTEEAVRLGRACGDPGALASALGAWCDAHAGPEHAEARLGAAAEMLAAGEAAADRMAVLMARRFRIVALLECGDPEVHQEIERFIAIAEALGQPLYRWYVPLFRGMQALLAGDLEEAEREALAAAALGEDAGSDNAYMLAATLRAAIEFERGHADELATQFEQAMAESPWMRQQPIAVAMAPLIDLVRGRPERARAHLQHMTETRFDVVPRDSEWLSTLSGVSVATLELRDEASAAALYEVLKPHAGRMIVDGIAASCLDSVDYLLGRLALITGRAREAIHHLEAAAEQSRRLEARLLEAHASLALAEVLQHTDAARAQELAERSRQVLAEAGAAPTVVFGVSSPAASVTRRDGDEAAFRRDGATWTLTFQGKTVHLRDAKGLHDLRHLLSHPATPVPAAALQDAQRSAEQPRSRGAEVLDDTARAMYRRRLADLDTEIADAQAANDPGRSAAAADERDFLMAELSSAVGLGGRSRRMGDDNDRARKAVTMRIRNAIDRISAVHPALGRHLDIAVQTGSVCSYEPEKPVQWSV